MKKRVICAILTVMMICSLSASQASENTEVLWTNNNLNAVHNDAREYYVMLDLDAECVVTSIMTYHYFNGGALPGTITLSSEDGQQWGPYQAKGVDGQGDVKNAYWVADVGEIRLVPGRYTIADSDQSTWSCNDLSDNYGIAELRGYYTAMQNPFDAGTDASEDRSAATMAADNPADTAAEPDLETLRQQANDGDADAQYTLGEKYYDGIDVTQDYETAASWLRKAAKQGHAMAQTFLGYLYETGKGVTMDDEQAVFWYRKAANQDYAEAQYYLGTMFDYGFGVTVDDKRQSTGTARPLNREM